MRFVWKLYFLLTGWKIRDTFPSHIPKAVIIVGPHTCAADFIIGLAAKSILGIEDTHYFGKAELFHGPFSFVFKSTGGFPVDRFDHHNMVDQAVTMFNNHSRFLLALSPEGTRKKVDRLRTGFYHIAKKAGVPIIMVGFDFEKKEITIAEPFLTSSDEVADFNLIINYYAQMKGKYPELGLSHLQTTQPCTNE
jgi:1-acyl-sn-glycerol-3-phosphate acyltransferase